MLVRSDHGVRKESLVPEAKRPGRKALATRARILDAAAQVIRDKGYADTRLADVAAAASTQTGSLYYHFKTREDLVEEMLQITQERTTGFVRRRVAALPAASSPLQRLTEAFTAHLEAVLDLADYTVASFRTIGQLPEDIRRRRRHQQADYDEFWSSLLQDAQAAGEISADLRPVAVREFVLGAMNSAPAWFRPRRSGLTVAEFERQLVALFLEGLATSLGRTRRHPAADLSAVRAAARVDRPADVDAAPGALRIRDAAAKVFSSNGYAGTKLADIAEASGLPTGSIYHHFASRDDLVQKLIVEAWDRTTHLTHRAVAALPAHASAVDRFATAIGAHLLSELYGGDYTAALVRIYIQVPPEVRRRTREVQLDYVEFLSGLLADAVAAGEIREDIDQPVVITLMTTALNWTVEWFRADGDLGAEQVAGQFADLVFGGLVSDRARSEPCAPHPSSA
jgi:AcrR family transcriptional regulator